MPQDSFVVMILVRDSRDGFDENHPTMLLESVLGDEVYDTLSDCNAAAGLAFYNWLYKNVADWDPTNLSIRQVDGCVVHMYSGKATMRRSGTGEDLVLQFYARKKSEIAEPVLEDEDSDRGDEE